MTDTSPEAVERLADNLMAAPTHHYIGYGQSSAFTLRALSAQLTAALVAVEQVRADGYAQGLRDAAKTCRETGHSGIGAQALEAHRVCEHEILALLPDEPTPAPAGKKGDTE